MNNIEGIVFYSTGCPKCKVLKRKLDEKQIEYSENGSVEQMLSMGIMAAPALSVNGEILNFNKALNWLKER